jgi:hypothetical protein
LSPRPDSVTTMILSFGMVGATFMTYASAWDDSMAGMMPSVLDRYSKAWTASSSVIATYLALPMSWSHACSGPTPG